MGSPHGADILVLYEPNSSSNAGDATVVQIPDLVADGFSFEQGTVENDQTDPFDGRYFGGEDHTLAADWIDADGTQWSQVETWRQNDTLISAVVIGYERNVQWYETNILSQASPVTIEGQAQGRSDQYMTELVRSGHGTHDIHGDVNLLRFANWENSDGNSDGVPDGYTNTSFSSTTFTDSDSDGDTEQFAGFAPTTGAEASLAVEVDMPVDSQSFTLSANFNQLHADGTTYIEMEFMDSSGTVQQTSTTTVSSTGRDSVTATSPSNTYKINCKVVKVDSASANTSKVQITDPALRIDGSTTYTVN